MKITASQLKKIIAEEVKKSMMNESMSPAHFYQKKSQLIASVFKNLNTAMDTLQTVSYLDMEPGSQEEDPEVRSIMDNLEGLLEDVEGILRTSEMAYEDLSAK